MEVPLRGSPETIVIMSLICAGLVKLLFVVRDRLLGWQEGFI